jgi:hypothetical protein
MLEALSLEQVILDLVGTRYKVEVFKDEDLELTNGTNLCLVIKDNPFDFHEFKDFVKPLGFKVNKYGNLVIFKLI